MSQGLISKGVVLTVPLSDGRRVHLTPESQPIPVEQVDSRLVDLLRNGDEYATKFMQLVDSGDESETIPTSDDTEPDVEVSENAAQTADSDESPEDPDDSDDGINWDVISEMNADDLVDQLEELKGSDRASFDKIIEWERNNKNRVTVLRLAE
jgi:hypothetical protein